MSLLLDHNLSPRLVDVLVEVYPGIVHVAAVGLDRATDLSVWAYARDKNHTIVSKDSDFSDLAVLRGAPPKVVWLRVGNCTTQEAGQILLARRGELEAFLHDPELSVLILA